MIVIDKKTEMLFDELNLKVTEDFVVELEQAVSVAKMAQLQDLEKINQQLLSDIQRFKQAAEDSERKVLEQQDRINKLTTSKTELEDQLRLQAEMAREEKKKLRNKYEYELGIMTGMNEAIMNQNDQMRLRILEQNDKIRQLHDRETTSKQLLFQMEERLSSEPLHLLHTDSFEA